MKARYQFVDDVLHHSVQFEVEQWLRFVDFDVAHGTVFAGLQVFHDATFADYSREVGAGQGGGGRDRKRENFFFSHFQSDHWKHFTTSQQVLLSFNRLKLTCVQALRYCGGVYEVTGTKVADNVFVQVLDLQLDLLLVTQTNKQILNFSEQKGSCLCSFSYLKSKNYTCINHSAEIQKNTTNCQVDRF